ncbi:hypothetical protein [Anthocerotibacter panamensis]|uniref:hypothetical protein n=1 Tax=Anthocerotibacter panamensis TaxID=2857077 RepID=UPI001C404075|nr:hypothetical protein [Anthocerotibacter panamensis]
MYPLRLLLAPLAAALLAQTVYADPCSESLEYYRRLYVKTGSAQSLSCYQRKALTQPLRPAQPLDFTRPQPASQRVPAAPTQPQAESAVITSTPPSPRQNPRNEPVQLLDEFKVTASRFNASTIDVRQFSNLTAALLTYADTLTAALQRKALDLPVAGVTELDVVLFRSHSGAVRMQGPARVVRSGGQVLDQASVQVWNTQAQDLGIWRNTSNRRVRYRITLDGQNKVITCVLKGIVYGKG